jgi:UDP-3-O-acyl-N-acetylglucosamine deacetylase
MANTFKRYTSNSVGTTATTVYTVSSPVTASVMIGGVISNVGVSTINATVTVTDTSSVIINLIGEDTPIPSGTALSFIDGKVVLQVGDIIKVKSDTASSLDVHLSVMEIS